MKVGIRELKARLSEYIEPELNAYKLEVHSLAFDVARIQQAVRSGPPHTPGEVASLRDVYAEAAFHQRALRILRSLDALFGPMAQHQPDIAVVDDGPAPSGVTGALQRVRARVRRGLISAASHS